jgi:hypothetical protein
MFSGGSPDGFCNRPAYGEQYEATFLPPRFQHPNRPPYVHGLCCDRHGGPTANAVRFMRDGWAWMAFQPDFENLQESVAGFGNTQMQAWEDLRQRFTVEKTSGDKGGVS